MFGVPPVLEPASCEITREPVVVANGEMRAWLEALRAKPDMHVARIPFGRCDPWIVKGDTIARPDLRFFSVSSTTEGNLLIEQPEVGLLAFVLPETDGVPHVVVHAKDEPGNLFLTQFAPTIQATKSNFERAHGGAKTPMLDHLFGHGQILSDTLQSEHSSHFWRKRNRNVLVVIPALHLELNDRLRIFPVRELLSLCLTDHAVNTDARSVLATAPWSALTQGQPFGRHDDGFGRLLRESYKCTTEHDGVTDLLARCRRPHALEDVPRGELQVDPGSMAWGNSDQAHFIEVRSGTREVKEWRQPIFVPASNDLQVLVGRKGDSGIEFLLRVEQTEALHSSAELAPTFSGACGVPALPDDTRTVAVLHQTDEGGRFWRATCCYEIRLLADGNSGEEIAAAVQPSCWVSLRQLQNLIASDLTTTNELRTLVSMLLYWL